MINKILEIAFSGFFPFLGMTILLNGFAYFAVNGILRIVHEIFRFWLRFMRMLMVRKHGWPPPHLDADGDWKPNS
ncbi:hypothetical protein AHMF7605_11890 [Adhaeribacter arboris]|uniref:Uncharacterized protein n=2 Tax=Adhaeribacter arboris TaxID=2072846 RepID=A0A2T2YF95_9BACT|nr:hypothetical protein AHMF7605_11890 [Adhaeribacter arboris]